MAGPITSYYASVSLKLDKASFNRVDKELLLFEKKLKNMMQRLDKSLKLELPAITVKKFKFDELALQRNSQMALNRVGRLLELPIQNFKINETKLTKQMQGVMQRAANAARVNVKTIQGSAGGSNAFFPKLPTVFQHQGIHMPNIPNIPTQGLVPTPGLMLPMMGGPAGMAVAGLGAAAYMGGSAVLQNRDNQQLRETQLTQLNVASGSTDKNVRLQMRDSYFSLQNELGAKAEGNIDSYSKLMKQLQAAGLDNTKSFKLYSDMLKGVKGNGGSDFQVGNTAYAFQQVAGLGYLRNEELSQQLGDSYPSFRKYIQQVYSERSGQTGQEAFMSALSKRQVKLDMVFEALERAANDATPRLEEYSRTLESERNRLANLKLSEEMNRAATGPVVDAGKNLAQAQQELYTSTTPLREAFDILSASSLNAGASLTRYIANLTGERLKNITGESIAREVKTFAPAYVGPMFGPVGAVAGLSYSAKDYLSRPTLPSAPTGMYPIQNKEWELNANKVMSFEKLMNSFSSSGMGQQTVNIGDVNLTLNSTATNGEDLLNEIRPVIRQELSNTITNTMLNYSNKE